MTDVPVCDVLLILAFANVASNLQLLLISGKERKKQLFSHTGEKWMFLMYCPVFFIKALKQMQKCRFNTTMKAPLAL